MHIKRKRKPTYQSKFTEIESKDAINPQNVTRKMLRKNRVKFRTNTNLNSFQVYHDTCHVILFVTNKNYKNKQLADTILLVHIHTSKEKRNQGRLDNVTL